MSELQCRDPISNSSNLVALVESLDAWVWAERISVIGLFVLAVGYTLFVVQELFVPVVTAWVMGAILRPIVESAERRGVPESWRLLLRRRLCS